MSLEIDEFDIGKGVDAFYFHDPDYGIQAMAVRTDLDLPDRDSLEVEARGYCRRPPKRGEKFCLTPRHPYDFDPNAIAAIRCVVEEIRPGWTKEVKDAARISNDTRWIAAWCELSPNAVVAIIENLKARGELPEG